MSNTFILRATSPPPDLSFRKHDSIFDGAERGEYTNHFQRREDTLKFATKELARGCKVRTGHHPGQGYFVYTDKL